MARVAGRSRRHVSSRSSAGPGSSGPRSASDTPRRATARDRPPPPERESPTRRASTPLEPGVELRGLLEIARGPYCVLLQFAGDAAVVIRPGILAVEEDRLATRRDRLVGAIEAGEDAPLADVGQDEVGGEPGRPVEVVERLVELAAIAVGDGPAREGRGVGRVDPDRLGIL